MSTRANVIISGKKPIILCHHHDGEPEYLGAVLDAFATFIREEYVDEYSMDAEDITNHLIKKGISFVDNDTGEVFNEKFELETAMNDDIEYLYILDVVENALFIDYSVKGYKVKEMLYCDAESYIHNKMQKVDIPQRDFIIFEE